MTPIYASDRLNASGWYAFQEPDGHLVIWDGGVNRDSPESEIGLWCPFSGMPVPRPASYLERLPTMPLYGWLEGDKFTVMDFPHIHDALNLTGRRTDNEVSCMTEADNTPLRFYRGILEAPNIFDADDCPAVFVRCCILPEDRQESRRVMREMGPATLIRHPYSRWSRQRNPLYASVGSPPHVPARVREITIVDDHVDMVTCWTTPNTEITLYPLYEGDQFPDNKVFVPTSPINLYIAEGIVVGYE